VAGDRQGRIYNVNADQMASACAVAYGVERLVFLTDVPGVLGADRQLLPLLSAAEGEHLIRIGVATGGMQAKLNAAIDAVRKGVREIVIASGGEPDIVQRVLAGEAVGSRLLEHGATNG
jgi:acetylglutamate kinase